MKPESWNVHVFNRQCCVQGCEQHAQALGVVRLNASGASRLKELPEPFVPE
jgi:hypothetical protein